MAIEVQVRGNNVEKDMRILKKKLMKDGMIKELRQRQYYEKPSLKKQRKLKENIARCKKEKRIRELKEGL